MPVGRGCQVSSEVRRRILLQPCGIADTRCQTEPRRELASRVLAECAAAASSRVQRGRRSYRLVYESRPERRSDRTAQSRRGSHESHASSLAVFRSVGLFGRSRPDTRVRRLPCDVDRCEPDQAHDEADHADDHRDPFDRVPVYWGTGDGRLMPSPPLHEAEVGGVETHPDMRSVKGASALSVAAICAHAGALSGRGVSGVVNTLPGRRCGDGWRAERLCGAGLSGTNAYCVSSSTVMLLFVGL